MVAALDIAGERYGRLTAVRRVANHGRRTMWLFKGDCGGTKQISPDSVRGGITRSCGCIRTETTAQRSTKHGHRVNRKSTRTFRAWRHAKSRCLNPRDPKYSIYGGRGITMCERWKRDFGEFLKDMGECPPGKSIDRKNPNGNYEPDNCRWATAHEQARTRTNNVLVKHRGETLVLKDFADALGVNYKALHSRVRYCGQAAHDAAMDLLGKEVNP